MTEATKNYYDEQERLRQVSATTGFESLDSPAETVLQHAEQLTKLRADRSEAFEKFLQNLLALTQEGKNAFTSEDEHIREQSINECVSRLEALCDNVRYNRF
jgi:hypothetical protein